MSIARLLMMAGRPSAVFIATQGGGDAARGFSLPTSGPGGVVVPGDFLIVEYYSGVTLAGGSGTAFTTSTFANTNISSRKIEADDLTTPFTFGSTSPYILMIVRGASSIGSAVRSGTLSGGRVYPTEIAGITPSVGAIGILGFANVTGSGTVEVYYHMKGDAGIPGPFDVVGAQLANVYGYAMGLLIDLGGYSGAPFSINTEDIANTITYRIHELY